MALEHEALTERIISGTLLRGCDEGAVSQRDSAEARVRKQMPVTSSISPEFPSVQPSQERDLGGD